MEDPERIVVPIFMGFGLSMTLQMFLFEWLFRDAQSASYRILGRAGVRRWDRVPFGLQFFLPMLRWRLEVGIGLVLLPAILILTFANAGWTFFALPSLILGIGLIILFFRIEAESFFEPLAIELAKIAAARISRMVDHEAAVAALAAFAAEDNVEFQVIAAKYLGRIGSEAAVAELHRLAESENDAVRNAAEEALQESQTMHSRIFGNHLKGLPQLLTTYRQYLRPVYSKEHDKYMMDGKTLAGLEEQIDQFLLPQMPLKWSFPHVYCTRCKSRAQERAELGWWWLTCKVCGEASTLFGEVQRAVGQIGGSTQARTEAGEYAFNILDDKNKTAIRAEIDVLEIVGGSAIDYDWAVSSVVAMIGKHFPERLGKVEVRMKNGPVLEAISVAMLKSVGNG
jgi:hypothetical protein